MMRILARLAALLALVTGATTAQAQQAIRLWPNGAPGSMGAMQPETTATKAPYGRITRNVSDPTLTVFAPDPKIATGTAVIIAPGGGCACRRPVGVHDAASGVRTISGWCCSAG